MKRSTRILTTMLMVLAGSFLSSTNTNATLKAEEVEQSIISQDFSCYVFILECDLIEIYCGQADLSMDDYDYARAILNLMDCDWSVPEPSRPVYYA